MLDDLKAFEAWADNAAACIPICGLPARTMLSGLHYAVFIGTQSRHWGGDKDLGAAIIQRASEALPLIAGMKGQPLVSAPEAITAFQDADPEGTQLRELLNYLHFCQLMPEVHRDYFDVKTVQTGFQLKSWDRAFADAQAKDITLSEIAIPFPIETGGQIEPEFADLARTSPDLDWDFVGRFVGLHAYKYRHGLAESDLITETSIRHMFGFDRSCFLRIRSVVLAYAEFCVKLATTMHAMVLNKSLAEDRIQEAVEWVSVSQEADWLIGLLAAGSQSNPSDIERFLELYSIDYRHNPTRHWGGDGFFPPFARLGGILLFSPVMVLSMLAVRNAIYAFSKKDRKTFNNDVSHELEPVLLHHAKELLERGGDWIAIEDIKFPGGQIDLVIASPSDNAVLLVQAKGNLPPQGARLTERLSDRIREGIGQIERFEALTEDQQREVVQRAIGRKTQALDARSAVLARSCFGAPEVFAPDFRHVRLTVPLLSLALERHRATNLPTTISALVQAINETEERIYEESGYHWEEGEIDVAGSRIAMPLLKWGEGSIDRLRRAWWGSSYRPQRD